MQPRILYLPIETKPRELLGKLLLGSKAVERGWIVVIGSATEIKRKILDYPPGLFVEISIPRNKAKNLAEYKERGHVIASLCEESVVYTNPAEYCDRKISNNTFSITDILIASGERNKNDILQYYPQNEHKIIVAGNPRFDTLFPDARSVFLVEASRLRKQFGRFLLVNTNFGTANHLKKRDHVSYLIRKKIIVERSTIELKHRMVKHQIQQMEQLKQALITIAHSKVFDTIIIRPHPSENHDHWREWGSEYGIKTRYKRDANTWMLGADAILHTGCTTGIEGLLLDCPTFSFVTNPGNEFLNLPDDVSTHVSTAMEFLEQVEIWKKTSSSERNLYIKQKRCLLAPYIENMSPPLASDIILDSFDKFIFPLTSKSNRAVLIDHIKSLKTHYGYPLIYTMRKIAGREPKVNYLSHKFPSLDLKDMKEPIRQWVKKGVLGQMCSFTRIGGKVWMIY